MFKQVTVQNYRCLSNLKVDGLTRVNLILGANNSGKTAFLEAVTLLEAPADQALLSFAVRRGERRGSPELGPRGALYQLGNVFPYVDSSFATTIQIGADGAKRTTKLEKVAVDDPAAVDDELSERQKRLIASRSFARASRMLRGEPGAFLADSRLAPIEVTQSQGRRGRPLSLRFYVRSDRFGAFLDFRDYAPLMDDDVSTDSVGFVSSGRMSMDELVRLWEATEDSTKEREDVAELLRVLEPSIQSVEAISSGIGVRLKGVDALVPLGALGEGAWRVFALALAVRRAAKSTLCIDEIDTGLHWRVQRAVWGFVLDAAKKHDVQVFATTHNSDSIHALGRLIAEAPGYAGDCAAVRLQGGDKPAVVYAGKELPAVAEKERKIQ